MYTSQVSAWTVLGHRFIANLRTQSIIIGKSIHAITDDNIPFRIRSKSYYLPGPAADALSTADALYASVGVCLPKRPTPRLDFDLGSRILIEANSGRLAWLRYGACVGVSFWVGKREITEVYIRRNRRDRSGIECA